MTAVVVALGLAVALLGALVVGLLRAHAQVLQALHELGVGLEDEGAGGGRVALGAPVVRTRPGVPEPRPGGPVVAEGPIVGQTPGGGSVAISLTPRPHATVLAFLSTGCTTCAGFWSAFGGEVALPGEGTQLVIVTRGAEHESPSAVARLAPAGVVTVQSSDAWERFGVPGSPYFALVDGESGSVLGEGSATTWDHVVGLLQRAVDDGGIALRSGSGRPRGDLARDAAARERRVDDDLAAAGIRPGHASLYPTREREAGTDEGASAGHGPD